MTTLRQRLTDNPRVRNQSAHTIKACVACIANFARHVIIRVKVEL